MTTEQRVADGIARPRTSSCRRGRSATRAPGSRCSPQPGVPRDPYEKIADAAQVQRLHRQRAERRPAHPVGPRRRLHRPGQARHRPRRAHRHDQLQRLPGRRLHARVGRQPRRRHPPQGDRPPAGVRRHHGRDRVAGPQAVVRRRHQLPRPGRHRRPPGPAGGGAGRGLRPPRRGPADAARVQAVRAGVLHDGRARLGHRLRPLHRARTEGAGRHRHRPPRPGDEHRVHRRRAAARRQARRVRLQLALLRRRRPDGRRRRPVPAVPHHVGGAPRRRPRPGDGGGVHARPVPQHRAQDRRPDPLGDERPGGHGQGAARRRRRPRRGPARRRRARRQRRVHGRLQHRRAAAARRAARRVAGSIPTRSRRTTGRATTSRSAPSARAAPPPAGERDDGDDRTTRHGRRRARRALEPSRRRPAQHQLRRRQHVGQGRGRRSGDRRPVELLWVKGSRRRPRDADRRTGWPCCASTGCAPSSTSTRASSARTRWSPPSTSAATAAAARHRRSTRRCTPSSTRRTSTTSTPTPASPWPPRPTARR